MTLTEHIYQILKQAELTTTREAFSRDYVGRGRNWFAWQRHRGRDFSLITAIQCLRSIRFKQQREAALNPMQIRALQSAERHLLEHLGQQYAVADICI
jgi:hypothetical protein